jgi:hypothetical protein
MTDRLIDAIRNLRASFDANDLRPPLSVRLPDAETGRRFARLVAAEGVLPVAPLKAHATFVDIKGLRFIWPNDE